MSNETNPSREERKHDVTDHLQQQHTSRELLCIHLSGSGLDERSCLGVWVIGLGGPMVGDVSKVQCALMTLLNRGWSCYSRLFPTVEDSDRMTNSGVTILLNIEEWIYFITTHLSTSVMHYVIIFLAIFKFIYQRFTLKPLCSRNLTIWVPGLYNLIFCMYSVESCIIQTQYFQNRRPHCDELYDVTAIDVQSLFCWKSIGCSELTGGFTVDNCHHIMIWQYDNTLFKIKKYNTLVLKTLLWALYYKLCFLNYN